MLYKPVKISSVNIDRNKAVKFTTEVKISDSFNNNKKTNFE